MFYDQYPPRLRSVMKFTPSVMFTLTMATLYWVVKYNTIYQPHDRVQRLNYK